MLNENVVFWTLSTLAQVLITLVALVSFAALWKLEALRGAVKECREHLRAISRDSDFRDIVKKAGFGACLRNEKNTTLREMAQCVVDNISLLRKASQKSHGFDWFADNNVMRKCREYGDLMEAAREHAKAIKSVLKSTLIPSGLFGAALATALLPFTAALIEDRFWRIASVAWFVIAAVSILSFFAAGRVLWLSLQDLSARMKK